MQKRNYSTISLMCAAVMFVFIFDSKTATSGAYDGIVLCLKTVVPALFPMMVLTSLLLQTTTFKSVKLASILGVPAGAEVIFFTGILGGYPVGAKAIGEAYRRKELSKQEAEHMLGFCSNCGPSFILGLCSTIFPSGITPILLWLIHIFGALVCALATRKRCSSSICINTSKQTLSEILFGSMRAMGQICGWIIIFRVIITFLHRWIFWHFPKEIQVVLSGLMELANGCCMLSCVQSLNRRFVLCSTLLAFGGLCVFAQTGGVCSGLKIRNYLKGKLIQTFISLITSGVMCALLDLSDISGTDIIVTLIPMMVFCWILYNFKKMIAFPEKRCIIKKNYSRTR